MVAQEDFFDKDIVNDKNKNKYFVINKGDFVYNPRKSIQAPYGPINLLENYESGIVSPLYTCFTVQKDYTTFLKWYFKSNKWYKYIYINGDKGARGDRVSIKDSVFYGLTLYAPYKSEMNKIDNFLSAIDEKINVLSMKISTLKKYKEGLLNLLIKSADEFVALKQLATLYQPKNLSKDKFNINGKYYVYGANGIIGKSDFYNHEKEEIVIGCRGNCNAVILTNKKSWINSNAMVVLPNDKIKKMELYYMMQTISFRKYIEGSGVPQITREKAKLIQVPFLKHNEQIFHVLANIDEIILNHNNIYEQLFKIKKNLLLNLFI